MNFSKRMIGGFAIALLFITSIPVAEAGPWGHGVSENEQNRQGDYRPARRGSGAGDGQWPYYQRRDGERDARQQRPQRLSPEERSQLRRDIKDAGRKIYPGHRH
ncbi:MAG: hypothetical protein LBU43_06135 [Candidatus Accumulibacter sp.]|nr:hypothetical protein [Accumulibacter sp.]